MHEPVISFAVPYFQGKEYLRECLHSVQKQTLERWEAVVIDDAGPEPAADLVSELSDSRITYARNSVNAGLAGNWNRAFNATRAPLVTILHADDRLRPNYARSVVDLMTQHENAAAVHCQAEIIDDNGLPRFSFPDRVKDLIRPRGHGVIMTHGEPGLVDFVRGSWIYCPTLCFRRAQFPLEGFDPAWKFMVDFDLIVRLLENNALLVGTRKAEFEYRRHSLAQTSLLTETLFRFKEELDYYESLAARCETRGWTRASRVARRATIVRLHLLFHTTLRLTHFDVKTLRQTLPLLVRRFK